jgi:hypothetical protein
MGAGCITAIIPCTLESSCAVASSAVAISYKIYEFNKTRKKRSKSLTDNRVLLPPITRKKRLRNNTE